MLLKTYIVKKNHTVKSAATSLGISRGHLSSILNGKTNAGIDLALKLSKEYDIPLELLIGLRKRRREDQDSMVPL